MVCRTLLRPVTEIESWKQKDSQPLQNASLNILVLKFKSLVKGVFKLRWRWSNRRKSIHPSKTSYTLNIPLHSLEMGITELPGLWQKKISQNTQKRLKKKYLSLCSTIFFGYKAECHLVSVVPNSGCGCGGLCWSDNSPLWIWRTSDTTKRAPLAPSAYLLPLNLLKVTLKWHWRREEKPHS